MLPIHRYHGCSVPARIKMPEINWDDVDTVRKLGLSKKSQALLETYSSLSNNNNNNNNDDTDNNETDNAELSKLRDTMNADVYAASPLDPAQHLHILYLDEHMCVTHKPSGVLSVPGPRRNPSLADLVYNAILPPDITVDQMVVHRIDMDTSGILVFALTVPALKQLNMDFRDRKVRKTYIALLAGHIPLGRGSSNEVELDLALERDPHRPPFMRVTQRGGDCDMDTNQQRDRSSDAEFAHLDFEAYPRLKNFVNQAPKPSLTDLTVQSLEYIRTQDYLGKEGDSDNADIDNSKSLPVTRVSLTPHTGRTHQLRVHTAAFGFPIIGDDIYGYQGAGDCGISAEVLDAAFPDREKVQRGLADLKISLCLHAQQLCLNHPITGAAMVFECDAPF
jgi:tRNA pseudouridine32 synthase/23S rRNA pseudouridine746 synthase